MTTRVESFMTARLFLVPQFEDERLFFLSNLSGQLSLYTMFYGGSVPMPLLPPQIALQNPELIDGHSFYVFPKIEKILVMIDNNGDENYQPMFIPLEGGFPEPAFNNYFKDYRVHLGECDKEKNIAYLLAERRDKPMQETYKADLKTGKLTMIAESEWGFFPSAHTANHSGLLLGSGYTTGDSVLYLWKKGKLSVIYGKPIEERTPGEEVPLNGLGSALFSPSEKGVIVTSAVFDDAFSLGYIDLKKPGVIEPVKTTGMLHVGMGEMTGLSHVFENRYLVQYNIDGCSWAYEAVFNEEKRTMNLKYPLVGHEPLNGGMLENIDYNKSRDI